MDEKILTENGIDLKGSLDLLGDIETYKSVMSDFLESFPTRFERITRYKENNDMTNYSIELHSLKSDAKYLGYTKLAELSLEGEEIGRNNNTEKIDENYNELTKELERVREVSQKFLEKNKSNGIAISIESDAVENIITSPSDKKIVLIADDSSIIRDFIKEAFNDEYEVIGLSNGKEVENIISMYSDKIAVLLLDLNMPSVDGFEVLDYFKNRDLFKKIPVSIITGNNDKDTINKAFNYPISSMLNKPFNKKDVVDIVKRIIEEKENVAI